MPSATGLMRLSLVIAAVFAAGIGALVAASALIPTETRAQRGHRGDPRRHRARADHPRRGHGLAVSDRDGELLRRVLGDARTPTPALTADRLTAKLQLLPLLIGNIEPADMSLTRPRIIVKVEPDGRSNWSNLMATLARTLKPGAGKPERVLSFSEIRMSGGTITVTEPSRGIAEELSNVELSFAWPSISRSFGATGRFVWRGEAFDASANAADLLAALSGDRSGLKVRLAGAPFKLAFDGHISQRPTLKMEGTLATDGKSLREAMRWAGQQPLPGGGFGPLRPEGADDPDRRQLRAVRRQYRARRQCRRRRAGALDRSAHDREGHARRPTRSISRRTSRRSRCCARTSATGAAATIAIDGLSDFDLDLRLSAARVTVATRQARPHRRRRQSARRPPDRRDRRGAGVRRRRSRARWCSPRTARTPTSSRNCSSPTSISKPASASCSGSAGSRARAI